MPCIHRRREHDARGRSCGSIRDLGEFLIANDYNLGEFLIANDYDLGEFLTGAENMMHVGVPVEVSVNGLLPDRTASRV